MESVGIYLAASVDEVFRELLRFGVKGGDASNLYYSGVGGSNLYVCLYPFDEEDEDVKADVIKVEASFEFRSVVGVDIGRDSNSWLACMKLVLYLNHVFSSELVIDDSLGGLWTIEEIKKRSKKDGKNFLELVVGSNESDKIWRLTQESEPGHP